MKYVLMLMLFMGIFTGCDRDPSEPNCINVSRAECERLMSMPLQVE